jgi:hypothetical protein
MVNNYSALGFWRSWHRSYNLWIIRYVFFQYHLYHLIRIYPGGIGRYIYVPLGGAKNVLINTLLVFSFVALWHDLSFRLLAWGWLVSLFIAPELLATYLLPASRVCFIPCQFISRSNPRFVLFYVVWWICLVSPCLRPRGRGQYVYDDGGEPRWVRHGDGWRAVFRVAAVRDVGGAEVYGAVCVCYVYWGAVDV